MRANLCATIEDRVEEHLSAEEQQAAHEEFQNMKRQEQRRREETFCNAFARRCFFMPELKAGGSELVAADEEIDDVRLQAYKGAIIFTAERVRALQDMTGWQQLCGELIPQILGKVLFYHTFFSFYFCFPRTSIFHHSRCVPEPILMSQGIMYS